MIQELVHRKAPAKQKKTFVASPEATCGEVLTYPANLSTIAGGAEDNKFFAASVSARPSRIASMCWVAASQSFNMLRVESHISVMVKRID